jgi:hypothetical protein
VAGGTRAGGSASRRASRTGKPREGRGRPGRSARTTAPRPTAAEPGPLAAECAAEARSSAGCYPAAAFAQFVRVGAAQPASFGSASASAQPAASASAQPRVNFRASIRSPTRAAAGSRTVDTRTATTAAGDTGPGGVPAWLGEISSDGLNSGTGFTRAGSRTTDGATTACISVDSTATLPGEARTSAADTFVGSIGSTWAVTAKADRADIAGLPTDAAVTSHADVATAPGSRGCAARTADHHRPAGEEL